MFLGQWKTSGEHRATVDFEVALTEEFWWVGFVVVCDEVAVPTFWDDKGNNKNPKFNLKERRRGQEQW